MPDPSAEEEQVVGEVQEGGAEGQACGVDQGFTKRGRSAPERAEPVGELPEPHLGPVEEAGGDQHFAGEYHQPDKDGSPAGTGQGGEHEAPDRDNDAEDHDEDPQEHVPASGLLAAAIAVLEAAAGLALRELLPVLFRFFEHGPQLGLSTTISNHKEPLLCFCTVHQVGRCGIPEVYSFHERR